MQNSFIDSTAKIVNSKYGNNLKCFRNASIIESTIGAGVTVGDDSNVVRCVLGNNVSINRRSYYNDSTVGDFSYSGINTTVNFTDIGKFCSLARNVDIGGFDHDYHKFTTMPMFRFNQLLSGDAPEVEDEAHCKIGNDVWIAAGAQVLHKVSIGDGAIVGGGAVVTKDVPPYAIVAGVPARIIKFRFDEPIVRELMDIKWWDWPENVVLENIDFLINNDVNYETLEKMRNIANNL